MSPSSDPQLPAQPGADIVVPLTHVKVVSSDGTVLLTDGTGTFYGSFGPNTINCKSFTSLPKVGENYLITAVPPVPPGNWKCTSSGPGSTFIQPKTQ